MDYELILLSEMLTSSASCITSTQCNLPESADMDITTVSASISTCMGNTSPQCTQPQLAHTQLRMCFESILC